MAEPDFDAMTALRPEGRDTWAGELADGWSTPRGLLGGYVMAIVLRGMELAVDDPGRMARSMTMHFLRAPQPGPIAVQARVERAGRSLSALSARLEQGGELMALALGAFSAPWESPEINESPMPDVAPSDGRKPLAEMFPQAGPFPDFAQRLTMQPRFGAPPFSGADVSEIGGWLGLVEERPIDSLATVLLADAWFPAPWPRLRKLAPAPTIDLTVHFRAPLPIEATLVLGRFRTRLVRDGFFEEDGELWAPDGTLVAQSRQLALLIGAEV